MTRRLFFRAVAGLASLPYLGPLVAHALPSSTTVLPTTTPMILTVRTVYSLSGITMTVKNDTGREVWIHQLSDRSIQAAANPLLLFYGPSEIDNFTTSDLTDVTPRSS